MTQVRETVRECECDCPEYVVACRHFDGKAVIAVTSASIVAEVKRRGFPIRNGKCVHCGAGVSQRAKRGVWGVSPVVIRETHLDCECRIPFVAVAGPSPRTWLTFTDEQSAIAALDEIALAEQELHLLATNPDAYDEMIARRKALRGKPVSNKRQATKRTPDGGNQ